MTTCISMCSLIWPKHQHILHDRPIAHLFLVTDFSDNNNNDNEIYTAPKALASEVLY